jgi:hypothetical protein
MNNSKINEYHQEKDKNNSVIGIDNLKEKVFREIENIKKRKGGELNISYWDLIALYICPCFVRKYRIMQILLEKSREEVSKYLNFLDLIKMHQEFSKLKLVLMNNDQINIFSYSTRPIISSYENLINFFSNKKQIKYEKLSVHQLFDSYLALNKDNDIINYRLIKLFDKDYISAFDYLINQEKIKN